MRVVTASAIVAVLRGAVRSGAASMVCAALSVLIRSASTSAEGNDVSGLFRKDGLELVAQADQFFEVRFMCEAATDSGVVVV